MIADDLELTLAAAVLGSKPSMAGEVLDVLPSNLWSDRRLAMIVEVTA